MSIDSKPEHSGRLSPDYEDLVQRFLAAYNEIDHELRRRLKLSPQMSFTKVVDRYVQRYPSWADGEDLKLLARLRNFVVHSKTAPYQRLAIPTPDVVEEIESIRERLAERVLPKFQREVKTVKLGDTLAHVLGIVSEENFSQFPVYDAEGKHRGLLTENGITRWLAHHTVRELTLVEFEEVTVEQLLSEEEARPNCTFVPQDAAADAVASSLGRNPFLEAVLITENGSQEEELLGIATRWDLPELAHWAEPSG